MQRWQDHLLVSRFFSLAAWKIRHAFLIVDPPPGSVPLASLDS